MLAVQLDHKEAFIESAATLTDVDLGWMHISAGTMAAVTRTYLGYAHGRSIIELRRAMVDEPVTRLRLV